MAEMARRSAHLRSFVRYHRTRRRAQVKRRANAKTVTVFRHSVGNYM